MDDKLYSSRIIDTFVKFIRKNHPDAKVDDILASADIKSYQVADEKHWFTQAQVDAFFFAAVQATGNRNIAREAGRYSASTESLGFLRKHIIGFVGPLKAYQLISKYTPHLTKSSQYQANALARNKVEITATPKPGTEEKPYQCENRIGHFEAIAKLFNHHVPHIRHEECLFEGGQCCRYIVTWQESYSAFWKAISIYVFTFLCVLFAFAYAFVPEIAIYGILPFSCITFMIIAFRSLYLENRELRTSNDSLHEASEKLLEQMSDMYNSTSLINELGLTFSKQTKVGDILDEVVKALQKKLDYDRGLILTPDKEKSHLQFHSGFGYSQQQYSLLQVAGFHLNKPISKGAFVICFKEQKPILVNDIDAISEDISEYSRELARKMGAKSFLCCPVVYERETMAVIVVDNIQTKRPLLQSDINLIMSIASSLAVCMYNARLFESKEQQFKSMIHTLAASIDARDNLTAGHSEKVAEYVTGICGEMQLDQEYAEMLKIAALVHDYGKIGIKDSILKKTGALTKEEFDEIKTHSTKTQRILEKISFEGVFKELPFIVGCHHEKLDGTGYPYGLTGSNIPLGARIIAVADVFDAITSKRHYREPMPLNEAFEVLRDMKGRHLDEKIVEMFVTYYLKEITGKQATVADSEEILRLLDASACN